MTTALRGALPQGLARLATRVAALTAALVVAVLLPGCAQLLPAKPAPASSTAAPAEVGGTVVQLTLVVPPALRPVLEKGLDLSRLQTLRGDEAIDDSEWARLVGAAPAQARQLLQTEGYFDAQVSVQRQAAPAAAVGASSIPPVQQITLTVQPGPRTQVTGLQVLTSGALQDRAQAGEADAVALRAALPKAGALQPGRPFRNPEWTETKQQLLARVRAAGYAAVRLADSQADIDATTQQARLSVQLASGPLFLAGPVQVDGLKRQDEATVRHLAGFGAGTPLTEARLLDWQERLQKAGLFESANVTFEPDPAQADAAPLRVRLTELPLQQATVGLGISANTGPRATLEHTHRRAFGQALTAHNKLVWGRDGQSWAGDFQSHPAEGFYRNLLGVQIDRVKSATDVVLSQRLRLGRTQDTQHIERLYFVEWLRSKQTDLATSTSATTTASGSAASPGATSPTAASPTAASPSAASPSAASPNTASALSINYHWVWRDLDSVLLPTRGSSWSLQAGAGEASSQGGTSGPYSRLYGHVTGYLPLGQNWYGQARLELGHILRSDKVTVPDALGFRAGGDDSVRGYGYRALAPTAADGSVLSGRSLLTGSVELAHPILARLPSVWGAVFIDAGRAVDRWADYRPALGYGAGVRWRSPIGPLKVDLAWGQEVRRLRLHFSVGIAF